jgi:hypothetical protein
MQYGVIDVFRLGHSRFAAERIELLKLLALSIVTRSAPPASCVLLARSRTMLF